jgi:hypothetical protein
MLDIPLSDKIHLKRLSKHSTGERALTWNLIWFISTSRSKGLISCFLTKYIPVALESEHLRETSKGSTSHFSGYPFRLGFPSSISKWYKETFKVWLAI